MQTSLTNNVRTHIVYVKTIDWKDIEEIHITKEQYDMISEDIQILKSTDFYTITDIDTWKKLFNWQRKDILRFKEKNIWWNSWYKVICDYWNKHDLINWKYNCDCKNNYWYYWFELKMYVWKKYWIIYPQDITPEMRKEFYLVKNNKNIPQN